MSELSTNAIVGIVIGCLAFIFLIWLFMRWMSNVNKRIGRNSMPQVDRNWRYK